jgi:SH3-like domain-containing protein
MAAMANFGRWLVTLTGVSMASCILILGADESLAAKDAAGTVSGLPIPRFVSLKSDRVNVRGGPTKDHEVNWVYTRTGLPVEVTAEFENWRKVRDSEGAEGWVYHSLLTGRRTVVVTLKSKDEPAVLRDSPDAAAGVAARLEAGVLATVKRCNGAWCRIVGGGFDGWIEQARLWGVYPNERID